MDKKQVAGSVVAVDSNFATGFAAAAVRSTFADRTVPVSRSRTSLAGLVLRMAAIRRFVVVRNKKSPTAGRIHRNYRSPG